MSLLDCKPFVFQGTTFCFRLTIHQRRQIEGALCRVPKNFYDRVWDIMTRTSEGIIVEGYHLPQVNVC